MTGEEDRRDRPPQGHLYGIELRERKGGAEVAIVRILRGPDAVSRSEDVWTNRYANLQAARMVMQVMMGRPGRWAVWVRMAGILGTDFLTGLIESEVVEAADGVPRTQEAGRQERAAHRKDDIEVSLMLRGGPRIVASRQGRRFMVMTLDDATEAWRVWDWIRWQRDSLQDWFLIAREHGAAALGQFILEAMLADETKAKAVGRSAAGRRPLRHWRPPGRKRGDREDGSGASDDE